METPLVQQKDPAKFAFPKEYQAEDRQLIFALSLYDDLFKITQAEVAAIKKAYPDAKIIIGGSCVNVSNDLRALASFFPEATAFVKGDGEGVITPLVQAMASNYLDTKLIEGLKGVYVREADFEYLNETTNALTEAELNAQPGIVAYQTLIKDINKHNDLSLHTSRSCKYRCVFCSHKYHPAPIYWSAERLIQELKRIKEMTEKGLLPKGALNIHFSDDDFFQDKERAIKFFQLLTADPSLRKAFSFVFQGTVASFYKNGELDFTLLAYLKMIRVNWLNFGTDGFHPEALAFFRKSHSLEMALRLIFILDEMGIPQCHYCILTFPTMSIQTLTETMFTILKIAERPTVHFLYNLCLISHDDSDLLPSAEKLEQKNIVISQTGQRKILPTELPLGHEGAHKTIESALSSPFPNRRSLRKRFTQGKPKAEKRWWRRIERSDRKLLSSKDLKIGEALLYSKHTFIKRLAIMELAKQLMPEIVV